MASRCEGNGIDLVFCDLGYRVGVGCGCGLFGRGRGLDHGLGRDDHNLCHVSHLCEANSHHVRGEERENDLDEEEFCLDDGHGRSQSATMQMAEYRPTVKRIKMG